jgi:hypothetical protein
MTWRLVNYRDSFICNFKLSFFVVCVILVYIALIYFYFHSILQGIVYVTHRQSLPLRFLT